MRSRVPDGYKSRGEGTPSNALYGKLRPASVYERVEITLVEVFKRVEKSVISVGKRPKRANRCVLRQ